MAKFENRYGVRKIVYKQKCRCFCPIGKADYTNEFTVTMEPAEIIPDYCEIDKFIRECLEGESLVIEEGDREHEKHQSPLPNCSCRGSVCRINYPEPAVLGSCAVPRGQYAVRTPVQG